MKQSQFYYLLRRGLFSAGSAIIKNGLVMFNKFTTAGLNFPAQGSASFDGSSDYIQLDNAFSHTNHTIAAWVYVEALSTNGFILDTRDVGNDGIVMFCNTAEQVKYFVNSSGLTSTNTFENKWVYAVGTYDGTTQKLYIDGSLDQSATTSKTISTTNDATIGANAYSLDKFFKGNLANVAIWNRALSSDEINSVMWKSYEGLEGAESNGLQAWYKLDESELFDASNTSTTNLEEYARLNSVTFEGKDCLQTALNALPDITDARLYSAKYDIRVSGDGGTVEALNCVETELNALL